MGDSPLGNGSRQLTDEASKPPRWQRNGLIVCRWRWRLCSLIPIVSSFFIFCFSQLTFQVTSQPLPTTNVAIATSPLPSSSIKNSTTKSVEATNTRSGHLLVDPKIAAGVGASSAFLAVIFVMGFLKYLRFRIRRKRDAERVAAVVVPGEDDNCDKLSKSRKMTTIGGNASVRRFGWDEMETLSVNFSMVIGSGGFSTVYLAHFTDSSLGAIKIQSSSERLTRVYKQELEILLHLRHDNIVKLLGYCNDREEGVLVFEYVPNGNLQEKLHGHSSCRGNESTLPWRNRINIAFQLAKAMEYLHEKCTLQIVHGDIKASNILLDENLDCKLCDFGSAKMGFSSTVLPQQSSPRMDRTMLGSLGYADPHYLRTGIASKKNDVYSFGVVVLELITGKEAFSSASGERLTATAGPTLRDAGRVTEIVDPRLNGAFKLEEAEAMASLSASCLSDSPTVRPSSSNILQIMKEKICSLSLFEGKSEFQKNKSRIEL